MGKVVILLKAITHVFVKSRIEKGWTKVELAKQASMSPSAIMRIENGQGVLPQNAKKIADALNKDIFDLFEVS